MSLWVAYYQYTCLLQFHLISIHVYYICTRPSVIACNNCIWPLAMSFTVEPSQQSCLFNLRLQACMSDTLEQTSIYNCDSLPSVLSVALAPDQYSSNDCYNCTRPTGLFLQLHPNSSQDGYEHLQHADILLSFLFVLIHCTALSKWYFLFFVILSIRP